MYTFDENIARIEQAKSDIKAAIEEKGVYVGDGNINTYANKVRMIKSAGKQQNKNITITENNTTTSIVADEGYILDKVNVTTDIPIQEKKELVVNDNGTYTISVDEEYEGLKTAEIEVNIPLEKGETRTYTQNGTYPLKATEGNVGIESGNIVVNVQGDGKPQIPNGFIFYKSTFTDFDMGEYDWSNHYYFAHLFSECNKLKKILNFPENIIPYGSTQRMFEGCRNLEEVPMIDLTYVGNINQMFDQCAALLTIPQYNTHNVYSADGLFNGANNLKEIPLLDFTNMRTCRGIFSSGIYYPYDIVDNIGGFLNIRCNLDLSGLLNISTIGLTNVITNLYDFTSNYIKPTEGEGNLTLRNYTDGRLTDELKALATSKGWTIKI